MVNLCVFPPSILCGQGRSHSRKFVPMGSECPGIPGLRMAKCLATQLIDTGAIESLYICTPGMITVPVREGLFVIRIRNWT